MASGTVVLDPVTGDYVTYDANGNEVSRFNPLTAFNGLGSSAPSGGSTMIGTDGKAIPMTSTPADPMAPPQQALPTTTSPDTGTSYDNTTSYGRGYNQRSSGRSYSSGSYGTPWYDSYSSDPFAGFGDSQPVTPTYADGSTHPLQGGQPRVAGGVWNTEPDSGFDNRQQVYVPGGAAAGPFETRAAMPESGGMTGNYGSSGGGGGGGGGGSLAQSMIGRIRSNVESRIGGMGPGGSSSSSGYTDTTKQYRRQGRRMDRAYEKYNEALANPKPLPVRGWVKEQGYKPGSVAGLLDEPGMIFGTDHNLNQFTDHLTNLPMTELAMMSFGTQGRNLMSKTPVAKVPAILRQNGVKPTKPDYKFTLDPSKVANKIAEMYGSIGNVNTTELLQNLASADKNSAVRQGIRQQAEYDPGAAFDSIENYIQAAAQMNANRGTAWGYDRSEGIHRQMLEMGSQVLGRKPKHIDKAIQTVANQFL